MVLTATTMQELAAGQVAAKPWRLNLVIKHYIALLSTYTTQPLVIFTQLCCQLSSCLFQEDRWDPTIVPVSTAFLSPTTTRQLGSSEHLSSKRSTLYSTRLQQTSMDRAISKWVSHPSTLTLISPM